MALNSGARAALVLAATVFGVALTANLGAWQLRRAAQKISLQTALDSRARMPALSAPDLAKAPADVESQHYRPVHLRGRWVADRSVFLENRQMDGRVGFYLVTPLQLEGGPEAVLVQRGWTPRDQLDRTLLPVVPASKGLVDVDGHIAPPPARLYEFSAAASGVIRQNLDLRSFAAETGLLLAPLSVQQDDSASTVGDGLMRRWPRPAVGVETHYGYAFQWFALCALMTGLYVWFQLVRPRIKRNARN
jgi:surfeit locus 1 family protein